MPLSVAELRQRASLIPSAPMRAQALYHLNALYGEESPTHQRTLGDEALYEACRWDYARFAKTFLPHWCPDDFNALHLDYYALLKDRQGQRSTFDAVAAPRGHSKTTGCVLVSILHYCVYETEAYTLYLTNRYDDAANKVRDMRDELEQNAALIRVYGQQVGEPWNIADFTTSHGQRVRAASPQTQLRGALAKGQRPTRVILDDVEHFEHVLNQDQRDKMLNWLVKDILHLGQPRTNYEVWGTILHEHSMLKTLFTTPGWSTRFYQAVLAFADIGSVPLWQTWRTLLLDLDNPRREEDAHAYFLAHQDAMLAGSRVLWPSRRPYIDLMISRLREGESSFWQEMQGQPLGDERHVFDMEAAAYCTVTPNGIVRAGGTLVPWTDIVQVGAYWDPVADKKDVRGTDYAACSILAQDRSGYCYILDAYCEQQTSTDAQISAIVGLLWKWDCRLIGVESNGFQSLLVTNIREAIKARALAEHVVDFNATIVAIVNVRNKVLRISSLEPLVLNHWLQFAKGLPQEFLRQFRDFLPIDNAGHDDAPDSVEGGIKVVKGLYERRDIV